MANQYLPLYRKYRPQKFEDLVGQDNLVKACTNAINTGRVTHAYLFCGPRGTGKTSSARILAKSLNCKEGPTIKPCENCPSCLDILNGNMLDVIEMDAASNRSVEDAQNIIDKIHYAPVNGRYKIFIIDEVHMISTTAFNALLKTLEEPPENVVFILATTEPQKVPETIISRCQRFDFKRITVDDIVNRLKFISEKESIKISDDALFAIAKTSQGGMRDALALLDQISVLDVENEISVNDVNEMLGRIDNSTLVEIAQSVFDKSADKTIQLINDIYSKGNEPLQIIENFIQYFRNLSIVKSCTDNETILKLTLLSADDVSKMKNQVQNVLISQITKIIERLTYYHKEIKFTNNRYLWLELCFIDLSSESLPQAQTCTVEQSTVSKPQVSTIKPLSESKNEEIPKTENIVKFDSSTSLPEISTPEPVKNNSNAQNEPVFDEIQTVNVAHKKSDDISDNWKSLLELIESLPSRSFFSTFAKPVEISETNVVIAFKNENFGKRAEEPQKYDAIKKACLKFFNVPSIELKIKYGEFPVVKNSTTPQVLKKEPAQIKKASPKAEEMQTPTKEEITETLSTASNIINNNQEYSDQAKLIKEQFDAKLFE